MFGYFEVENCPSNTLMRKLSIIESLGPKPSTSTGTSKKKSREKGITWHCNDIISFIRQKYANISMLIFYIYFQPNVRFVVRHFAALTRQRDISVINTRGLD